MITTHRSHDTHCHPRLLLYTTPDIYMVVSRQSVNESSCFCGTHCPCYKHDKIPSCSPIKLFILSLFCHCWPLSVTIIVLQLLQQFHSCFSVWHTYSAVSHLPVGSQSYRYPCSLSHSSASPWSELLCHLPPCLGYFVICLPVWVTYSPVSL